MVLYMAYCATFMSHLTVQTNEMSFIDFQGLFNDGTYKLGVVYENSDEAFLKVSHIYVIIDVYMMIIINTCSEDTCMTLSSCR